MKYNLADICNFIRETVAISEVNTKNYISTENLMPNKAGITVAASIPKVRHTKAFNVGDVLVSNIRPYFRKIWYAKFSGGCSNDVLVFRSKNQVDPRFLYYVLADDKFFDYATATSKGTKMPRGDRNAIMEYGVPNISYDSQRKIADILSALDDKIELNQRINKNLEEQAQVIFDMEFVEKNKSDNKNQKGWRNACLSDIAQTIVCGKTPSTKKPDYYGEDMPFITIPDMYNSVYITKTTRRLSMLGINSQKNKILPSNSVCVSCIGTAGLVSLVAEPSQTNQQINTIIPLEDISSYFIFFLLKSLSNKIQNLGASGSTIPNLNKSQFSEIEIMIPPKTLLEEFDSIVAPFFNAILEHQYQIEYLSILRDTLLPRLMSGEIDVSNIVL